MASRAVSSLFRFIHSSALRTSSLTRSSVFREKSTSTAMGDEKPVETAIHKKLSEALKPEHLEVINESYMHNVPKGTESHFKVVIVSSAFENVKRIDKHKLVHKALQEELESSIHALSIVAKTPQEWETSKDVGQSPACRGGAGL
ncbi:unnamed protein product [Candidula unifasciata]|uniref:BolA-like protein 1 n=1 Tax=Candidula unifasciata TaxID=100452 RepID=A0A8S3Z0J1_9EUPU|nr:unnamed protein product [Candidula unifasciata]